MLPQSQQSCSGFPDVVHGAQQRLVSRRFLSLAGAVSVCALMLAAMLAAPAPAAAQNGHSKLDRVLRSARSHGSAQRVIIRARPGALAALKSTLQRHGDDVQGEHGDLDALTVVVHGEDLAALEANPAVLSVSVDAEVTSLGGPGRFPDAVRSSWFAQFSVLRETLGLSLVPFAGAGVNVAVVDSGISPSEDLDIAGFWDFTRGGVASRPKDDYGHGTHVAGLIAGTGLLSDREFAGVAPSARLYGFKVLDKHGRGRASDVVRALEFIVANRKSKAPGAFRIDVINLSLGHPIYEPAQSDPLVRAVENAVRAGIVVVTAAGNIGADDKGDAGYAGITSPGNAPSAITVGAIDSRNTQQVSDDRVASFSSRGPTWFDGFAKPDILAPGVGMTSDAPIGSSLLQLFPQVVKRSKNGRGSYARLNGTSMASAVAAGVATLVVQAGRTAQAGPALSPNAVKAILQYTAFSLKDSRGRPYDRLTQGTGAVNARGAVALALAIDTRMPTGAHWLRGPLVPYTLIGGSVVSWSKSLIWRDRLIGGSDVLTLHSRLWNDNIVWGTALGSDDNIVWGTAADVDNIVWGTAAGDNIVWGTSTVVGWALNLVWDDRIVGLLDRDNIVWGTAAGLDADNIVWGTVDGDNIVWGTWKDENIVWGTADADNIVWGTAADGENIVWGTSLVDGALREILRAVDLTRAAPARR